MHRQLTTFIPRHIASIALAAGLTLAVGSALAQQTVLFGTHVTGSGKGFSLSTFDEKTGVLSPPEFVAEAPGPAYFVLAAGGTRLYTCNSNGFVSAYSVANAGRSLTLLNRVPSEGGDPSYISLDRSGRFLFNANYQGGNIIAWALQPDGSIGQRTAFFQHTGTGVDPQRQRHAYAHSILVDPTNRYVLSADLGLDKVFVYRFNSQDGTLTPNDTPFAEVPPGLGARHIVFAPDGHHVFVDTEMGSKIVLFRWNAAHGTLVQEQVVSMLPPNLADSSAAAEMRLGPTGRFLYATNRYTHGDGDIVVFAIDRRSARLTPIQHISSGGNTPRNFDFDRTGRWLLVTNHGSNNAVVFRIDAKTGMLTRAGDPVSVPYPFSPRFVPTK